MDYSLIELQVDAFQIRSSDEKQPNHTVMLLLVEHKVEQGFSLVWRVLVQKIGSFVVPWNGGSIFLLYNISVEENEICFCALCIMIA